jgi:tetratricopeptide (TPR) repeat protein
MLGRELELAELLRQLDDGVPWITVHGTGGIGKSKLLLALASELQARGDAEVISLSLASIESGRGLAAIADAVGCDGARIEVLGEVLAAKPRSFLIIDNAESCILECATLLEYVIPKAPDLQVVLGSRVATGSLSETIVRLGPLALAQANGAPGPAVQLAAREMQRMGIRRESTLPAAIATHTNGYPLAIVLAVGKLRVGVDPLTVLFGSIEEASDPRLPERQQSIARVLEDTCNSLPRNSQIVLALYTTFVELERTRAGYAEAYLPMTGSQLNDARHVLVEHALFEPETWSVPEFVRQWVRDRWKSEAKDVYVIAARAYAEGLLTAMRTDTFDALHRNDLEPSAEVLALQAEIAQTFELLATVTPRFDEGFLLDSLRGALALVYAKGFDLQSWMARIEAVFPSQGLLDADARAFKCIGLGRLHRFQDDYARSLSLLEEALREKLSPPFEAACKLQIAMTHCRTGAWEKVFAVLDSIPPELTDASLRAEAQRVRAWAHHLKGDKQDALLGAEEATRTYAQAGMAPSWMSQAMLAITLRAMDRQQDALAVYERVIPRLSASANRRAAAIFFSDYATFLLELRDYESALRAAEQARGLFDAASDFAQAEEAQVKAALAKAHVGGFSEAAADLEILYTRHARSWDRNVKPGLRTFVGALRALLLLHLGKNHEAKALAAESRRNAQSSAYAGSVERMARFVLGESEGPSPTDRNIESTVAVLLADKMADGQLSQPSRPILRAVPGGVEIQLESDKSRVELQSRAILQRLLAILTEAHLKGRKHSTEELIEQTWPGERMLRTAGRNRIRVAIRTLRELGLSTLILTTPTGYAIADHVLVENN